MIDQHPEIPPPPARDTERCAPPACMRCPRRFPVSKKKMIKVVSAKELSRTTSDERRGTISWAMVGWACKLECGHTVKRSASGRHSPPDRCHCTECAAASAEVQS